jgi:hypothetical protein
VLRGAAHPAEARRAKHRWLGAQRPALRALSLNARGCKHNAIYGSAPPSCTHATVLLNLVTLGSSPRSPAQRACPHSAADSGSRSGQHEGQATAAASPVSSENLHVIYNIMC